MCARGTSEVAIVTGGASGIGRALGGALVARGADVTLADIDEERALAVAEELDLEGPGSVRAAGLDVADATAVTDLVRSTHARHGRLDLVFNNAGIGVPGEPDDLDLVHWERTIDVNLRGVINGCHAAYPLMRAQGHGHIVNTASLAGLIGGLALGAPYTTTKHAVVGLSLALRAAGEEWGVKVHVVCPGGIDTPIIDSDEVPGLETPPSGRGVTARAMAADMGVRRFYPPERLAADILRGVDRDRAVIVAPMSARVAWRAWRLAPGLMLRVSSRSTSRWRRRHAAA